MYIITSKTEISTDTQGIKKAAAAAIYKELVKLLTEQKAHTSLDTGGGYDIINR
ncbi:MAG: hypothetical protein ACI4J7_00925 [Ruminiclostridium sp.]